MDESRFKEILKSHAEEHEEIMQVLGKALGYPYFCHDQKNFPGTTEADGVAVGEHVPVTIAIEAARHIGELQFTLQKANEQVLGLTAKLETEREHRKRLDAAYNSAILKESQRVADKEPHDRFIMAMDKELHDRVSRATDLMMDAVRILRNKDWEPEDDW